MSIKVVEGREVKFRPIADLIGEEIGKDWKGCTWGMVYTSKDNPNLSAHIERIPKHPIVEMTAPSNRICYVLDGEVIITYEGKTYHLYQGDFMLAAQGDVHGIGVPEYVSLLVFYNPPLDKCLPLQGIS